MLGDVDPRRTRRDLLIVEDNCSGHRLFYVRILVLAALRSGRRVTVALAAGASDTEEFELHLGQLVEPIEFLVQEDFGYRAIARLAESLGARHVVVPDGDRFALVAGLWAYWPSKSTVSILALRAGVQTTGLRSRVKGRLRKFLFLRADRKRRVSVFLLRAANSPEFDNFRSVPDPVVFQATPYSVAQITEELGLDAERTWFGIVGAITLRKNVALVAEALMNVTGMQVGLVIAGKQDASSRIEIARLARVLDGQNISLIVRDRLISDLEMDSIIGAVDCVVVAHSNEGPSGVLNKAMAAGTPVVAAGAQTLKLEALRWPSHISWSPLQMDGLTRTFSLQAKGARCAPFLTGTNEFSSSLLAH